MKKLLYKILEKLAINIIYDKIKTNTLFINNVCLSYRHDYPLLNQKEKEQIKTELQSWIIAIHNNIHK